MTRRGSNASLRHQPVEPSAHRLEESKLQPHLDEHPYNTWPHPIEEGPHAASTHELRTARKAVLVTVRLEAHHVRLDLTSECGRRARGEGVVRSEGQEGRGREVR